MNDTISLRDHSQSCGHNEARPQRNPYPPDSHRSVDWDGMWRCDRWECPGGKEISLTKVVAIFLQLPSGTEQEISLHSSSARMWAEVDGND